jgi:diguanylate cyclase (GGDEF)-like protein
VGRVGGEEFLVLGREANLDGALVLAERIRSSVESTPITHNGLPIRITVSVGFAVADAPGPEDADALLKLAAEALGYAKGTGRNRSEVRLFLSPATIGASGT